MYVNKLLHTTLKCGKDTANALSTVFYATELACVFAQCFETVEGEMVGKTRKVPKHRPEKPDLDIS